MMQPPDLFSDSSSESSSVVTDLSRPPVYGLGRVRGVALGGLLLLLAGCDQLGLDTPAKVAERKLAEAKAVGSACRHAMRAIEDCYVLNPKADKSAVFAGWREMDEYMRENKLEGVTPVVPRPAPAASKPSAPVDAEAEDAGEEAPDGGAKAHKNGGH
jgi:hypothetical protein